MLRCSNLRLIGVVVVATIMICCPWAKAQETPHLQLCDIFKDIRAWDGKLVAIQGSIILGFEQFAMHEPNCPVVPTTDGVKWPTSIGFTGRDLGIGNYTTDQMSLEFFQDFIQLVRKAYYPGYKSTGPNLQIRATLVGVLRVGKNFGKVVYEGERGPYLDGGFGHMNSLPAQIEYLAVEDISISGLKIYGP